MDTTTELKQLDTAITAKWQEILSHPQATNFASSLMGKDRRVYALYLTQVYEGEPAIFLPADEQETMYPLVCNITKLSAELVISIKYAVTHIEEQDVKKLLASYINCLHENI